MRYYNKKILKSHSFKKKRRRRKNKKQKHKVVSLGENTYPIDTELAKKIWLIWILAHIVNEIKGVPFFYLLVF